jgi:hypothetical protein
VRLVSRLGVAAGVAAVLVIPAGSPLAAPSGAGKSITERHLDALASVGKDLLARLRPEVREALLSSGGLAVSELAENVEEIKKGRAARVEASLAAAKALPRGQGSDPFAAEDFVSRLTGMTQSETTIGWCGRNAVLGFNDSGSFVATAFLNASPSGSLSLNGLSRSTNAGASYTDLGALVSDPLPAGVMFRDLFGDPVVGCSSASTFYYSSLAVEFGKDFAFANSGIAVSRSTDGGATFGGAVLAASKNADLHFLDKEWMAVEPGPTASPADDVVHVTYTDFDFSGFEGAGPCPDQPRSAIEYVRSTDGGGTWTAPVVLDEVCGFDAFVQGSQVEAGLGDDVYVAWEHYTGEFLDGPREIRIRRSVDLGDSFGDPTVVSPVTAVGDGFALQGLFRAFLDLQGLSVDRSSGPHRGSVYVSWHDGRSRSKVDPLGFCGGTPTYCFGDVLFARSTDRGSTWSNPVRVNNDDIRLGIDQFMPGLDVDRSGNVWVTYSDRRRDSRNFLIDQFVAKSTDGGAKWANSRLTTTNFAPVKFQDAIVNPFYMGDYNAVAADATGANPGVALAWGDNSLGDANVRVARR